MTAVLINPVSRYRYVDYDYVEDGAALATFAALGRNRRAYVDNEYDDEMARVLAARVVRDGRRRLRRDADDFDAYAGPLTEYEELVHARIQAVYDSHEYNPDVSFHVIERAAKAEIAAEVTERRKRLVLDIIAYAG